MSFSTMSFLVYLNKLDSLTFLIFFYFFFLNTRLVIERPKLRLIFLVSFFKTFAFARFNEPNLLCAGRLKAALGYSTIEKEGAC